MSAGCMLSCAAPDTHIGICIIDMTCSRFGSEHVGMCLLLNLESSRLVRALTLFTKGMLRTSTIGQYASPDAA